MSRMKVALVVGSLAVVVAFAVVCRKWDGPIFASKNRTVPFSFNLNKLNVILIVVDTLAAKHLHLVDGGRPVSPALDRFAASAVTFTRAYTPAPWTKPAVASIMTGSMPSVHGLKQLRSKMNPELPTMAELFKEMEHQTAGFVSHTFLAPQSSFSRGFDTYELVKFRGDVHDSVTSDQVTSLGVEWLDTHTGTSSNKPFFLFLHYFDPHFNYQHHEQFDRTSWYKGTLTSGTPFSTLRTLVPTLAPDDTRFLADLYREEISFVDQEIGRLSEWLHARGLDTNTLLVFTADHGEEFMEHGGIGHGRSMYDEVIRVPLTFSLPGHLSSKVVKEAVSTVDILPTLFALKPDAVPLSHWNGQSLLPLLSSTDDAPPALQNRALFSEVDHHAFKIGLVKDGWKMMLDKTLGEMELYDLNQDPVEKNNLYRADDSTSQSLAQEITDFMTRVQGARVGPQTIPDQRKGLKPEAIKQLESLGYL